MAKIKASNLDIAIDEQSIQNKIYTIRGAQVMIDRDLAEMYEVQTKRLNEQVKRNIQRFPHSFRFQLTEIEKKELVADCDRFKTLKHSTSCPYAFTEQGVSMLSAVLTSDIAIEVSIKIIESFVSMRKLISSNSLFFDRFESIEQKPLKHDNKFNEIFDAIEEKGIPQKQHIFYNGQIFDAYIFLSDIIKSAKRSIKLIDNYIDESTLVLFTKRDANIETTLYTKTISKQLQLDLKKHNEQYEKIEIKKFNLSHDRFLIIDETEVYHFGASLKDLGKKWFAVSKMDIELLNIMERLK